MLHGPGQTGFPVLPPVDAIGVPAGRKLQMYVGIDQTRQDIAVLKIHDPGPGICRTQFLKGTHLLNPASFQNHSRVIHLHVIGIIDSLPMDQYRYLHLFLLRPVFSHNLTVGLNLSLHCSGRHTLYNVLLEYHGQNDGWNNDHNGGSQHTSPANIRAGYEILQ